MKLIVAGASGFVGTEVIRRSLSLPQITSVIALARRPVSAPKNLGPDADTSKLQSVVVKDYDEYPEDVKKVFVDADACIWTVAITPSKSKLFEWETVYRICHDYTITGIKTMAEARRDAKSPFRFLYMSGATTERDPSKTPSFMPQYCLMRGKTEVDVLKFATEHDLIEACVAKPGLITQNGRPFHTAFATVLKWTGLAPNVDVTDVALAMLDQVINGFEKEPLQNDDLVRLGRKLNGK